MICLLCFLLHSNIIIIIIIITVIIKIIHLFPLHNELVVVYWGNRL
jgi:hypothetical protein